MEALLNDQLTGYVIGAKGHHAESMSWISKEM